MAFCGGSAGSTVCVLLPNNIPPTKGPYFTDGSPCSYNGDVPGDGNSTDTNTGQDGGVYVDRMVVGEKIVTDIGLGFNAVSKNIVNGTSNIKGSIENFSNRLITKIDSNNDKYMKFITSDLARIAQNTTALGDNQATAVDYEIAGALKSLYDLTAADSARTDAHRSELTKLIWDVRSDIQSGNGRWPQEQSYLESITNTLSSIANKGSGGGDGGGGGGNFPESAVMSIYAMHTSLHQLNDVFTSDFSPYLNGLQTSTKLLGDISGKLDKLGEGGGTGGDGGTGGEEGKPCKGPLCSFSEPSVGGGSGLSSVFGEQDIAGIKQQVTERKADIQEQMDQIKGVFSPGKLQVSGSYDNDYHDINGAKIDLSGKSNIELFFSLGPKQVLWFLAVLIAFGILLGGRKDA